MPSSFVINDISMATMIPGREDYGMVRDGAIVVAQGKILWAGDALQCPDEYRKLEHHGYGGRHVTPALIDCHTHIVHGGNRAREFEMRLNGASYEEIASG